MDTAVALVKAYLELCGYFVLAELPVRAAGRQGYHDVTDLDVVAVRFPHLPRGLGRDAAPLDLFLGLDPQLGILKAGVDVLIGEVKEGHARLNPALQRARTVAFALWRVGCCPEPDVEREAWRVVEAGTAEMAMPGRVPCRVRLVAFAGHGTADERGVLTVPLGHCADFIARRLRDAHAVVAGAQFKDPVLGLFVLQAKLAATPSADGGAVSAGPESEATR